MFFWGWFMGSSVASANGAIQALPSPVPFENWNQHLITFAI